MGPIFKTPWAKPQSVIRRLYRKKEDRSSRFPMLAVISLEL